MAQYGRDRDCGNAKAMPQSAVGSSEFRRRSQCLGMSRNALEGKIDWQFAIKDARVKLRRYQPTLN